MLLPAIYSKIEPMDGLKVVSISFVVVKISEMVQNVLSNSSLLDVVLSTKVDHKVSISIVGKLGKEVDIVDSVVQGADRIVVASDPLNGSFMPVY